MQACFNTQKASRASLDKDTHSDFLLAPSPAKCSFKGWAICPKPFMKLPVMAYEAEEGSDLGVSLWQCILSNSLQVCVVRPNTLFRHLMG